MLGLTPFMRGHQMLRTWLALMGASLSTFIITDPVGYIMVDGVAAAIVMARPAGLAQKAIGALFTLMMLFDLVYALTPQHNYGIFINALRVVGWAQWAVFAGWVIHDRWGRYLRWVSPASGSPPSGERRIR